MNQGSGVLDVAGGKGELSFELLNLNGINATVVEPRALQLWRQHKWMLKGFYHRNVNFQSYLDHKHQEFTSGLRACVDPPHLRMVFDEAVVGSLLSADQLQHSTVFDIYSPADQQQQSTVFDGYSPANQLQQQATVFDKHSLAHEQQQSTVLDRHSPADQQQQPTVFDKRSPAEQPQHSLLQPQHQQLQQHNGGSIGAAEYLEQTGSSLPQHYTSSHAPLTNQPQTHSAEQTVDAPLSGQQGLQGDDQSADVSCADAFSQCQMADRGPQPSDDHGRLNAWRQVLQQSMHLAKDIRWTHKGLQHESSEAWAAAETGGAESPAVTQEAEQPQGPCTSPDPSQIDNAVGATDITDLDKARSIIQDCSVVVGIHPDQAAEPIINFAQKTRRPFAMVPCCVYPMEFPRRKLPDGTWVRKYEQLIQYLQFRDPEHIHVATLPFEGRNQVVYCKSWT